MQTIKTVAIVFLLMSVIYGAYISLTTPPEPLPAGIEDMLALDETGLGSLDSTLPPALPELGISDGESLTGGAITQPPNQTVPSMDPVNASDFGQDDTLGEVAIGTPADPAVSPTPNALAPFDLSATQNSQPAPRSSVPHFDLASSSAASSALPSQADPSSTGVSISLSDTPPTSQGADANYPQTGSVFNLPDPDTAIAGLTRRQPDNQVSQVSGVADDSSPSFGRNLGLANAIRTADTQFGNDQRREALATLSIFYSTPNLSGEQRSELLSRLDPLAADVIYSREHLLERPYRVGQDETLMQIAARYEVPWQLLANINQVRNPTVVVPGTELKVVRGPFRAEVNMATKELTLFLGDLYAGRFPIGIGNDPVPPPGTYTVQDKQPTRTFYDASGSPVPAGSPNNPYGNAWIDLGGQICIHGSPSTTQPTSKGCISLAADHADDLYGILSHGSSVIIR